MEPAPCRLRSAEWPQVPSELHLQPPSPRLSVAFAPRARTHCLLFLRLIR